MTMITPSYLGETIEYSSLHACRSTLEDPTYQREKSCDRGVISVTNASVFSFAIVQKTWVNCSTTEDTMGDRRRG